MSYVQENMMSSNVFKLDQDTLTKIHKKLDTGDGNIGSSFYLDGKIQEFAVYNSDQVTYTLEEFNLIEPEDLIDFRETAGTVYFYMEK